MYDYGYLIHQTERARSGAEQRATDVQLGQLSATLGRLFRSLARPVHALRPQPGYRTGPVSIPASSAYPRSRNRSSC